MLTLPEFPWDALADAGRLARAHPEGIIDLSVGSPVDPTPEVVAAALRAAADAHAYPTVAGTLALRDAAAHWFARTRGVAGLDADQVMPTVGSKEFIAGAALWLGLGRGDTVVFPRVAYPTYDIGARLVGATPLASDDPDEWPSSTRLVWLNSPGNPTGRVDDVPTLRRAVTRARELGAVVISDECYALLPWEVDDVPSVLDPRVTDGDLTDLLVAHSVSKQSSAAGYRAALVAGDRRRIAELVGVRKHLGLMVPAPIQAAMVAALDDDRHVQEQRARYRARRDVIRAGLDAWGLTIDHSQAGLYVWATRDEPAMDTVLALASLGILVAPGSFYGADGSNHVRVALTVSDAGARGAHDRLVAAAE